MLTARTTHTTHSTLSREAEGDGEPQAPGQRPRGPEEPGVRGGAVAEAGRPRGKGAHTHTHTLSSVFVICYVVSHVPVLAFLVGLR